MSTRLAVISGGSRGLGQALCASYLDLGFEVVEFSRTAPARYSVAADFADPDSAARIFEDTLRPLAARDWAEIVVIHNAGVLDPIGPVAHKRTGDVLANINANVTSGILFLREALRQFREHACDKTLANISSGAALKGYAGWSLYCAGKAALENFVRAVAAEQIHEPARFTALNIDPGVMDTAMQSTIRDTAAEDFPDVGRFIQRHASGELRAPRTVARAVVSILQARPEGGARISAADLIT